MTAKAQMEQASIGLVPQEKLDALISSSDIIRDSADMSVPVGDSGEKLVADQEPNGDEMQQVGDKSPEVGLDVPLDQDGTAAVGAKPDLVLDTAEPAADLIHGTDLPAAVAAEGDKQDLDEALGLPGVSDHQVDLPAVPAVEGDEQELDEALGLSDSLPAAPAVEGDGNELDDLLNQADGVDHQANDLASLLGEVPDHLPEASTTSDGSAGALPEVELPEFDGAAEPTDDTSLVIGDDDGAKNGDSHTEGTDADLSFDRTRSADRVKNFLSGRMNAIRGRIDKLKLPANKTNKRERYRDVLINNKAQIKEKITHVVSAIDAQLSHPAKKKKLRNYAAQITTLLDNVTNEYDVPTPAQLNLLKSKLSLVGVELDFSTGEVAVKDVDQKQIDLFLSGLRSDTLAFVAGVLAGGAFSVGATALAMARPESQEMVQAVRQGLFYAGAAGQIHTGAVYFGRLLAKSDKGILKKTGAFVENLGFGIEKTLGTRVGTALTRGLSLGLMGGSVGIGLAHQHIPTSPWAEMGQVPVESQPESTIPQPSDSGVELIETPAVSPASSPIDLPAPEQSEILQVVPPQLEESFFTESLVNTLNEVDQSNIIISDSAAIFDNVTMPDGSTADVIVWRDSSDHTFVSVVGAESVGPLRLAEITLNKKPVTLEELGQVGIEYKGDINGDGINDIQVRGKMSPVIEAPTPEPSGQDSVGPAAEMVPNSGVPQTDELPAKESEVKNVPAVEPEKEQAAEPEAPVAPAIPETEEVSPDAVEPVEPAAPAESLTFDPETHTAANDEGKTVYEIQPGDTAWNIATENGVSLEELAKANDTTIDALRNIRPGQQLTIPDAVEPVEPAAPVVDQSLSKWDQGKQWVENSGVNFVDEESKTVAMDLFKDLLVAEEKLDVGLDFSNQNQADKLIEVSNDTWAKFQESKDFSQMSPVRQLMMRLNIGTGEGGVLSTDLTVADLQAFDKLIKGTPVDSIVIEESALDKFGSAAEAQAINPAVATSEASDLLKNVQAKYQAAAEADAVS